nr:diguanylate cyclase [Granulosicoccus sp.]
MSSQVNERVRHASLVDLQVLDTESEAVFDGLVEVAARVCDVPISLISLIDSERQWFKANVGLDGVTETPREIAFCNHTIQLGGYLEVPDASEDSRFENNPLVTGSPNIRFYAGATLELSNGARAGTLCVIDQKPRSLSKEQRIVLTNLARAVVQLLQFKRLTGELAVSESRFKALCEASPLGIFSTDRNGLCTYSNARWQSIFGLTREHTLPENWLSELHPEDKDHVTAQWKDSLHNNNYFDLEFRVQKESDHCCSVRAIATPVYDNQGTPVGHVGAVEDISEITSQRQKLAEQHELLSVTLSSIGDAVITTNADSMITWLNPTAEKMTGWSLQHATGQPLGQVFRTVNQHTRKVTINPVDSCLARDETVKQSKDIVLISHSGEEHGIQDSAAPIRNDRGEILGAVLVFHDVTEQRRLVSEMKRRATHDHLTGLVNREEFEIQLQETLNHAVKNNSKNALLYIDLDRFKIVNDTCGHSVGDLLLIQVTKIMKNCIRSSDILARIGGDEFGVILKECSSDQAERVANLICKKIDAHKFVHSNQQFRIGSSIGLVPLDRRWDSITTALQAADSSCYIAKESGRNRVNRWLEIDQQVNIRNQDMQWVSKLQTALDNNLFSLHAQIIQNIKDNAGGLHAEVLLRLTDSDGRTIPPNVFIPAAERY